MSFLKRLQLSLILIIGLIHANTTVYENGDNIRANWNVADGSGSISVVTDMDRGNKVIELNGTDGLADSFKISDNWNESNKHIFSWKMKYNEDFTFYVKVKTKNNGIKYIIYKPLDNYNEISNSGNIRIALGTSASTGIWKTFTRDIKADIQMYNSGYKLDKIINIIIRGSGRLDDIMLSSQENTTIVYENGDNIRANWNVVDGSGSISVVTDMDRGNKVIELSGTDGLADSFKINDNWNESNKHIFSWKMKYNEDFTFYVKVKTRNNGIKYIIYKPLDNYSGISNSGNIRIALGTSASTGIWKTFTRDIKADIQMYNSGYKLDKIINIIIRGSGRLDDIQIQSTLSNLKRIFILGSSTVHIANYISSNRDPHGSGRKLAGWGNYLKYYLKDSSKVYNRARSGADSVTYINPDSNRGNLPGYKDRYWGFTKNLIQSTNDNNGGFLLIQFGANDAIHHIDIDTFKNQLRYYISEARKLGLIPVLISPPNSRNHINSRPYAKYIEPIADSENVLFLDLHQKSMDIWSNYEIDDYNTYEVEDKSGYQRLPQADILYGYLEYYRYINNTHFSPTGAKIVAGWIKELACQSDRNDGKLLCKQFSTEKNISNNIPPVISLVGKAVIHIDINTTYHEKGAIASDDIEGDISTDIITLGNVNIHKLGTYKITYTVSDSSNNKVSTTRTVHVINPNAGAVTVYEDAEDGDTAGWGLYSTTEGANITNVVEHGGHAIKLEGNNGLHNGFKYPNFTNSINFITSWSLKYTNPFRLFVLIRSTNSPNNNIYMEYTPEKISRGLYNNVYIHNGLGTDANDGTWHTFTRDIQADFHTIYPNENVTKIVGFAIRGSGLVDNLIIKNK